MKTILLLNAILLGSYFLSAQENMNKPFNDFQLKGSITIFDYKAGKWISSDIDDSVFPTLPASTFKIVNTLIALETNVIKNENEVIKWPGSTDTVKYGYRPNIYKDMDMQEAFKVSSVWAYIELAKMVGKEKYKEYLTACNYGNADVSINDVDFWNFGELAISPVNQIKILIGIYEETLPFKKENFAILKNMMIEEQTDNHILRAKTGWTRSQEKNIGWWVGYVERKENVYFFATRVINDRTPPNPNFSISRKKITKTILRQLEIIE